MPTIASTWPWQTGKGCQLWTGDRRLYNALHSHYAWGWWISDYQRQCPDDMAESP